MSNKENNVKKPRCIPQNLSMSESAPVCQPWSYAGSHAMGDMLNEQYFLSAHDRIRPGDTIRIVQMKDSNIHARDNEVIAFANVTIIKVDKMSISMTVDSLVVMGEKPLEVQADTEFIGDKPSGGVGQETIEIINQTIEAMQEAIKVLQEAGSGLTKDELTDMLQGKADTGTLESLHNSIGKISTDVAAIQESMTGATEATKEAEPAESEKAGVEIPEDADLVPYHKWNPGKGEHQAVIGEGKKLEVLFCSKDKDKVLSFIAKQ